MAWPGLQVESPIANIIRRVAQAGKSGSDFDSVGHIDVLLSLLGEIRASKPIANREDGVPNVDLDLDIDLDLEEDESSYLGSDRYGNRYHWSGCDPSVLFLESSEMPIQDPDGTNWGTNWYMYGGRRQVKQVNWI